MIDGESSLRPLDTASLALAKCEAEEPVGIIKIDVNDENPMLRRYCMNKSSRISLLFLSRLSISQLNRRFY